MLRKGEAPTEPMMRGSSGSREIPKTEPTPSTSAGSPAGVPVPWHSSCLIDFVSQPYLCNECFVIARVHEDNRGELLLT